MRKFLVIVESPAKAKTINKILDHVKNIPIEFGQKGEDADSKLPVQNSFVVKASMGHVKDLPQRELGVDVEKDFKPKYITIKGKDKILKELKKAAEAADYVLLAADPDREGEAICWHLSKELGKVNDSIHRISFNEITEAAIKSAVMKPEQIDDNKFNAQQARRILDRLVGYKISPLLWRKIRKGLSAGRVQSVAVRLICDREDAIEIFIPEEYWSLTGLFSTPREENFLAKLLLYKNKRIKLSDEPAVQKLIPEIKSAAYSVMEIKKKKIRKSPPPPFITSMLQQDSSRKLNMSVSKTMRVAQQLYEGINIGNEITGLITYMRTDSFRIADEARAEAADFILKNYGKEYLPAQAAEYKKKKNAQDAHECIRPTHLNILPDAVKSHLSKEQHSLYKLIWDRFMASQMSSSEYFNVTADLAGGEFIFRATGSTLVFDGFLRIYQLAEEKERRDTDEAEQQKNLPELAKGEEVKLSGITPKQHFTQPPPRFNEASLVKELEEKGIGRPSTYASIITTIIDRGYVDIREKKLFPTLLGRTVTKQLVASFPRIMDISFTAEMEGDLDKIEEGKENWTAVLKLFYANFSSDLDKAYETMQNVKKELEKTDKTCEKCGSPMLLKENRFGKFYACSAYPECKNTKPFFEDTGVDCPVPSCGGKMVSRRTRTGKVFYSCSRYPDCKFALWDKPINKTCQLCGSLLVEKWSKMRRKYIACSNRECAGSKPVKKTEEAANSTENEKGGESVE